jgi:hypothetical protein
VVQLDIFVSAHCFGCEEAHRLAAAVASRFDAVAVRVVDLDVEPDARPEYVVAVPAYVLEQQVISLGSPRETDLFALLEQATSATRPRSALT